MKTTFAFDGGNLALDFLNTTKGRGPGARELLTSPAALLNWLNEAGLLPEAQSRHFHACPPDSRTLLAEAYRLREEIAAAVRALAAGGSPPDSSVLALNRVLGARRRTQSLLRDEQGLRLADTACPGSAQASLAPVAEAAALLLVDGPTSRLGRCKAVDCAWWFLDTSKNGRRKWCSMARCGNRAKVAAHYRRKAAG